MSDDTLSEEDKALFRAAVAKAKPLEKSETCPRPKLKPSPKLRNRDKAPSVQSFDLSNYYSDEVGTETILKFSRPDMPYKRLQALSKGEVRWQARLDLHGLTAESAQTKLCAFINQQQEQDHRSLLIIHGKGGAQGNPPILKNLVYHWLKQIPAVLAFHSAKPRDGGAGALYVLLKRAPA